MPRRKYPVQTTPADWSPEKTYSALKAQLGKLASFRGRRWSDARNEEQAWSNLTLNILTHGFGQDSNNIKQFQHAQWAGQHRINMSDGEIQNNYNQRIEALEAMLRGTLAELELIRVESPIEMNGPNQDQNSAADLRRVFVVHGHDAAVTGSVARFLERLDLQPIILHEQPNQGRTVIEKFEAHSDVGFAVVLLTPDDRGAVSSSDQLVPRARQNVILELGYFIGKLGRARVCALYVEGVEIPSDIHGVLYVPYDDGQGWRLQLASEIRSAGIPVDLNRI
jgi:predicted nucleotide-binding protein